MFSGENIPCVGVSVGVERVFTLMEKRMLAEYAGKADVDVVVASTTVSDASLVKKMKITKMCWEKNIKAEFATNKFKAALTEAVSKGVKFVVVVGDDEWARGVVKVKDLGNRTEDEVKIEDVAEKLKALGAVPAGCEFAVESGDFVAGMAAMKVE
jgi:histidyl-tRNA synthetase